MFKFIKQYVETMTGVTIYPIISLLIFFIFFVVLLVYVKKDGQEAGQYSVEYSLRSD